MERPSPAKSPKPTKPSSKPGSPSTPQRGSENVRGGQSSRGSMTSPRRGGYRGRGGRGGSNPSSPSGKTFVSSPSRFGGAPGGRIPFELFVQVLTKPPTGQTLVKPHQSIQINIQAANRRLNDGDFKVFLAWFEKNALPKLFGGEIPSSNAAKRKRVVIRQFQIQDNFLSDQAMNDLTEFLLSLDHAITVRVLKCWNNKIGDAGAISLARLISRSNAPPLLELHLSHNKITTKGAVELLRVVASSPAWPVPPKNPDPKIANTLGPIPLWLRLEHNFIFASECLDILKKQGVHFCAFNSKAEGGCNNSHCSKGHSTKFHLAFFEFQYFHSSLAVAKEASMSSKLETRLSSLSLSETPAASNSSEDQVASETSTVIHPVPLFIFMDTNAVVNCVNEKGKPMSFDTIRTRFESGLFSTKEAAQTVERVFLVLTDTVLGELDSLSKRGKVNSRIMEEFFTSGEKSGYILMLGAHEGEKLVREFGKQVSSSDDIDELTRANDRMIIDVALMYAAELGDDTSVCFVSEDKSARMTARNHNLRTVSLEKLNEFLHKDESKKTAWRSTFLRKNLVEIAPMTKASQRENPIEKMKSIMSSLDQAVSETESIKVDGTHLESSLKELEERKKKVIAFIQQAQESLRNFRLGGTLASIAGAQPQAAEHDDADISVPAIQSLTDESIDAVSDEE